MRIGIDIGGTFTDIVCVSANGRVITRKVLSSVDDYSRSVREVLPEILQATEDIGESAQEVIHGTTVATNAILEQSGALTALITTEGFRDVLELRRIRMPELYDWNWDKPPDLVERRLRREVRERVDSAGQVLVALEKDEACRVIDEIAALGVKSVAVCLINSYGNPDHERIIGRLIRERHPNISFSLSSDILREAREYERTATTVINAYVRPLVQRYVASLSSSLKQFSIWAPLLIMQSNGGVMTADACTQRPVFMIESGPAAGVIGSQALTQQENIPNAITFDMGGTTAKASIIEDGLLSKAAEYEIGSSLSLVSRLIKGGGHLIRVPAIDVAEVGAGGGSIAWLDSARVLHAGPRSAGASPAPVCYDQGGQDVTITDANLILGYLNPEGLAGGTIPLNREKAEAALRQQVAEPLGLDLLEAAYGVHLIANSTMMRAIRAVSTEKGRDVRDFALIAFGGSGPVHACGMASSLEMKEIIVPVSPGLFSAFGLLSADIEHHRVQSFYKKTHEVDLEEVNSLLSQMEKETYTTLINEGLDQTEIQILRFADLRYSGQSYELTLSLPEGYLGKDALTALEQAFDEEHERTYGHRGVADSYSLVNFRLIGKIPRPHSISGSTSQSVFRPAAKSRMAYFGDPPQPIETPVLSRFSLTSTPQEGPLLIDEYDATTVVAPGYKAWLDKRGSIHVQSEEWKGSQLPRRGKGAGSLREATERKIDPITLGLIGNQLSCTANEMANTVIRSAYSTVIRDCMDFSTALCDKNGQMVAQGVTIPLQLGSIPFALAATRRKFEGQVFPGDVFIMNDPFEGGIHIPDVFIFQPIFHEGILFAFSAAVAHHLDMGGRVPGSAACDNTEIFQEGLRIPPLKLYKRGEPNESIFEILEKNVRVPLMTLGDIRAKLAACRTGEKGILKLTERYPVEVLEAYFAELLNYSERMVRAEIRTWKDGEYSFTDYLDDDGVDAGPIPLRVKMTVEGDSLTIDFTGSSSQVRGAINSPLPFTVSCSGYAVRSVMQEDIPNTSGIFRPIRVIAPEGSILNPVMPAASGMRGVTGFRLSDALFGALAQVTPGKVPAAGEGGNSLIVIGGYNEKREPFVMFDLVAGTWGARPSKDGNDGLTNPASVIANIPAELMELEYPVRLEEYSLAQDSGGAGRYRGGLAVTRQWRYLGNQDANLCTRTDRCDHPPYGLSGGGKGAPSRTLLNPGTAQEKVLSKKVTTTLSPGDAIRHIQPGGGGWGDPLQRDPAAVGWDVVNEKVSIASAEALYGVVIDPKTLEVDEEATLKKRAQRAPRSKTSQEAS